MKHDKLTFVIGDIHGQNHLLQELINSVQFTTLISEGDEIVFLGDYIDRGPDSPGVIDTILDLKDVCETRNIKVTCLSGNHEEMLGWLLQTKDRPNYQYDSGAFLFHGNGGPRTINQYLKAAGHDIDHANVGFSEYLKLFKDVLHNEFSHHLEFFDSLAYRYENEHAHYVHAGFKPFTPVEEQTVEDMTWIRYEWLDAVDMLDFGKPVIHGHTYNIKGPSFRYADDKTTLQSVNLDTGVFFKKGKLTCLVLPSLGTIQVSSETGRVIDKEQVVS